MQLAFRKVQLIVNNTNRTHAQAPYSIVDINSYRTVLLYR